MTPNARTKQYLERQGHLVAIVEYWTPFPKPWGKRHDLFGVFDLIMLKDGGEIWGVQATSTDHLNSRIKKLEESPECKAWLAKGGKVLCIGWAKRGKAGERKLWTPKEVVLNGELELPFGGGPEGPGSLTASGQQADLI